MINTSKVYSQFLHNFNSVKFTFIKTAIVLMLLTFGNHAVAQKQPQTKPAIIRCGTMEAIRQEALVNPELRAKILQGKKEYQQSLLQKPVAGNNPPTITGLNGPVIIPVVVHIILPNPWVITDDAVKYFIDRLNADYSGLNTDSTNGQNFYPVRGHSLLRFTLAKRDPAGYFTTGIIRKVGTTEIALGNPQPVKNSNTATGGSTGWDVTKYYNLYVANGGTSQLLGIAPTIGPGGPAGSDNADGVCVDYRSFANGCFSYPAFALGRTAVHEIGHNFGLYHPFDDGCSTNDFAQLLSAGCSLPSNLLAPADDVPVQNAATQGCPQPGVSNGCTNTPKMFQNYMDYTDDACYSMFSKGSVARMEWVLENCRSGYLTTQGGTYPVSMAAVDVAAVDVLKDGLDFDNSTCTSIHYPAVTCPGNFTPRVRIVNAGINTLTAVTVSATINGGTPVSKSFNLQLPTGKTQVLSLPDLLVTVGNNLLKFTLSSPNNGIDGNNINDTISTNVIIAGALPLPYTESFESPVFPPANGSIIVNKDEPGITWERTTLAGRPGNASMRINCYNYLPDNNQKLGQRDIFRLPPVNTKLIDSLSISFNVAYQQYFDTDVTVPPIDSLRLIYSGDCGTTWLPLGYAKGGASLSTVAGTTKDDFVPVNASQWRTEKLMVKDLCKKNIDNLIIGFESVNDYGNNIYVDSIAIVGYNAYKTNAVLKAVTAPASTLCVTTLTPAVIISNDGTDSIRSVKINYKIDNGTLSTTNWTGVLGKCTDAAVLLSTANVPVGTHTITVFLSAPNGIADEYPVNDSITKIFSVFGIATTPVSEDFEEADFPKANWSVQNVSGVVSWQQSFASARSGKAALWINNPLNANSSVNYFISPIVSNSSLIDSMFVDFDLAYRLGANFPGSGILPLDTLEVFTSTDCGNTLVSVWKKSGTDLQTIDDPNISNPFIPSAIQQWKPQRIYLTPFVGSTNYQVYIAAKGNRQNYLWLDNINITSKILPQRLKEQGYLIYPNPFTSGFLIHFYAVAPPTGLKLIEVFSSSGQLIYSKSYKGNAERQITIDLKNAAKGLYVLKMSFTNKTIVERIVKD